MILKVVSCKNFLGKLIGLLGAKKAYPIYFKTRFGIHTFGMRFTIDVVILDTNNRVINLAQNLKPNKIFFWNPRFDQVIELPAGEIKNKKIKVGDKVELLPLDKS